MFARGREWVLLFVVVGFGASAMTAPVTAASPTISVDVNGSPLPDGGSVTVTENPTIGVDVSANSTINTVSVRVDGKPRRSFSPGSKSFSKTVTIDVEDGAHSVTVVASADTTTTHGGTVTKDSTGPRVAYTSPFTTSKLGAPDDIEVAAHGNTTLAGTLHDISGVEQITIQRTYTWKFAGEKQADRNTYRITDPGDSFSQPLVLGPGNNRMKVTLTDVHGQTSVHEWTLRLEDRTKPRIRITSVERLSGGARVRIAGVVSDDTKVRSLSYTTPGSTGGKSILSRATVEPTRERLRAEFSFTAEAGSGIDALTLIAEDTAGNERTREVSLNFEKRVDPVIAVEQATLTANGTVHVVGSVTEGRVRRVTVETVGPDGSVVSLVTVYSGDGTEQVAIDERLRAADGTTRVVVRAVDTLDRRHKRTFPVTGGGGTGRSAGGGTEESGDGGGTGTEIAGAATGTASSTATTPPETLSVSPGFGAVVALLALLTTAVVAVRSDR